MSSSLIFPVNPTRFDPYKGYRFLLYFTTTSPTTPVAAVSKVTGGLKRSSDVIEYKEAGNRRHPQGPRTHEVRARSPSSAASPRTRPSRRGPTRPRSWTHGSPSTSLANLRQEVSITLLNEEAQPVLRWLVHRCWVSEYQALPDLDAGSNTIAIEHIKLENEGWERDTTLLEPLEQ